MSGERANGQQSGDSSDSGELPEDNFDRDSHELIDCSNIINTVGFQPL